MPKILIFDIDGTLADCEHRRHHLGTGEGKPNWNAFFGEMVNDPVIPSVYEIIRRLYYDYRILLVTGRPDNYDCETVTWLNKHFIRYDRLFMRKSGDNRSDTIVKKEILAQIREDYPDQEILGVFDDRQSVVDMWREEGLTCFQCAPGDFDKKVYKPGELVMMVGPSGAGKSTYVQFCPEEKVVSSDRLRSEICGDFQDQSKNEQVFNALRAIVKARIENGLDVVVDATNIKNRDRRALRDCVPKETKIAYLIINRPMEEKLRDGGWRLDVKIGDKNLIEYHEQLFKSNLKAILAGDNDPRVEVIDERLF